MICVAKEVIKVNPPLSIEQSLKDQRPDLKHLYAVTSLSKLTFGISPGVDNTKSLGVTQGGT